MDKKAMTQLILEARKAKDITWKAIGSEIGLSPVYTCSACLGMNSLDASQAQKLCRVLDLPAEVADALQVFPHKSWDKAVPTDPVIYRLYEVVGVYGDTIKELIHEEFGNGIMSAIDFSMYIDRVEDPRGDRVKVTMEGKFLPYRSW